MEVEQQAPEGKKKQKERGKVWTDDETRCLVEGWKKYATMDAKIGSKIPFRQAVVSFLKKSGHERTEEQVRKRIANLKTEFRVKSKPSTGSAGGEWKWRKDLCELLRNDFHTPNPKLYKQSRTPATPSPAQVASSPDETQGSGTQSATFPATITEEVERDPPLTPISFHRSRKEARKPPASQKRLLDLLEREVLAKERMADQTALMASQQARLLDLMAKRQPSLLPSQRPDERINSSHASSSYPSTCGNCGQCNLCDPYVPSLLELIE